MRLWHIDLIPYLSNKHLSGQHRECCALRGRGWGKQHATVNYVFTHDVKYLIIYHMHVMNEMIKRGYLVDMRWFVPEYRGKHCSSCVDAKVNIISDKNLRYPEHNDEYLQECKELLIYKNPQYYTSLFQKGGDTNGI